MGRFLKYMVAGLGLMLLLGGCGESEPVDDVPATAPVADKDLFSTVPCEDLDKQTEAQQDVDHADLPAELAGIYARSCKMCHENPQAGAPLRGNADHWAERIEQGADVLLDHTVNGYRSMPPLGLCMACTEAEFLVLINYIAGTEFEGAAP